jgi:23S rRNA pseudouridine1911/1915/1917 synthase
MAPDGTAFPVHSRAVTAQSRVLDVTAAEGGRRLDVFLADRLSLSRAEVRRLLGRGAVVVDGRPVGESAKGTPLAVGSKIGVAPFSRPDERRALPDPDAPLVVLASGPGWLAVDKPAGVAVHPLREEERGTVLNAVIARHPELFGVGEGGLRSGVVHRLDVETSGVLLVATAEPAWRRLREAFQAGRVEKVYRALVRGRMEAAGGTEIPLVLARHRPARVRIAGPGERSARPVVLAWRPLERFADATLVEVRPRTGFLHQIRVVLAHVGHPILGDRVYADAATAAAAPRHLLHASAVAFEEIAAASPDPADLVAKISELRT